MKALEVHQLNTFYGKSHVLHGVDLDVGEGELVTLLGRNGAGKSTTLRSIMGLIPAQSGLVTIFGTESTQLPSFRIAQLGVGFVPEGRRVFSHLTVEENLKVPMDRPGHWNIARVCDLFPRLAKRKRHMGRQLSGGEQEMLSIARALLLNPKLLLLDEPSQGLAPIIVQNVRAATEIADRAYVLDRGTITYSGPAAEFGRDEKRVQELAGASAQKWEFPDD